MYIKDLKKTIVELPYYIVPTNIRSESNVYYYDINNHFIHDNHLVLLILQEYAAYNKLSDAHSNIISVINNFQVYPVITFRRNTPIMDSNHSFRKIIHSSC